MDYIFPTPPVCTEIEKISVQIRECASAYFSTMCGNMDDACYCCSGACSSFGTCSLWDEFLKLGRQAT